VQITETATRDSLADAYPYFFVLSPALLKHSRENVLELIARRELGPAAHHRTSKYDGYLLKTVEGGIPVLGIDPAEGHPAAEKLGVPTRCAFFSPRTSPRLGSEGIRRMLSMPTMCSPTSQTPTLCRCDPPHSKGRWRGCDRGTYIEP